MSKMEWLLVLVSLTLFWLFFSIYRIPDEQTNEVDLNVTLNTDQFSEEELLSGRVLNIRFEANNNTTNDYASDEYFYRITLGRNLNVNGFVLREFTKELKPGDTFSGSLVLPLNHMPTNGGQFYVYFSLYKDRDFAEPLLISASEAPITFVPAQKDL